MQTLHEKVFRGWPRTSPALNVRKAGDVSHDGLRLRGFDYTSEEGVDLRVWLLTAEKVERPGLVVLSSVDEAGWKEYVAELGPEFKDVLQAGGDVARNDKAFKSTKAVLEKFGWAFATVAPRGIGPTRWSGIGTPEENHIKRRFALVGQTLDGQRVWDVRRALAVLRGQPELKKVPLWLQGKGDMAGIVLYSALFEPDVARLDLWDLPASHAKGPIFLNVRRTLDLPQAVALAFPRRVMLYAASEAEAARTWAWPLELQKALGQEYLKNRPARN